MCYPVLLRSKPQVMQARARDPTYSTVTVTESPACSTCPSGLARALARVFRSEHERLRERLTPWTHRGILLLLLELDRPPRVSLRPSRFRNRSYPRPDS